jgi:tetratricopeptide (TPR) repeat protein
MKHRRERKSEPRVEEAAAKPAPGKWIVRGGLLAIAFAAYFHSFGLGLAQDSFALITQDARIREVTGGNLALIVQKDYWWPKPGDHLYRPVTTASLLFNYAVLGNGASPAGYHWVNFLLHGLNVWLVYELASRLLRRAGPSFLAAALWAAHPINSEAVVNIVGRSDLLAAMSVLGGLLLYARAVEGPDGPRAGSAALLFGVAAAGVFAKESAAVLPGMMLLWDLSFGIGERRAGVARRVPYYAAAAAALAVLFVARHFVFSGLPWPQFVHLDNPLREAGFPAARWTAIKVLGLDLWLLVFPLRLSSDRSYNQIPLAGAADPFAWMALAAIAGILTAAVLRRRRDPVMFWAAGFTGIALLPTANLVTPIGTMMAERFLYLPAAAFTIALAALAFRLPSKQAATIGLAALAVIYAVRSNARAGDWNSNLTLAEADVQTAPQSVRLHDTLAKSLFEQGERNLDRAIEEQEKAWAIAAALPPELSSDLPPAHLGIYYGAKATALGSPANERSRPWYEKSLAVLLRAREISLAAERSFDRAQLAHGKPLTARPVFKLLYFQLAYDYLNLGRYGEALEALRYGRNVDPRQTDFYELMAVTHQSMGRPDLAVIALEQKALVDGEQPATLAAIREAYVKLPDAGCAALEPGPECGRVKSDMCRAAVELRQAYVEARMASAGDDIAASARQRYGCR